MAARAVGRHPGHARLVRRAGRGTRTEVAHLLEYLETSGCQFQRNGSWYPPARAASYLNQKYEYMLKKGLVTNTESFIEGSEREQRQRQTVLGEVR